MRKNVDVPGKGLGVIGAAVWGAGLALAVLLILILAIAALIWQGILPSTVPVIALSICIGLCGFIGGRFSIGKGSGDPMVIAVATGTVLASATAVICLCLSGQVPLHGGFLATILLILAGGGLAGLFGRKKRRTKKKR